MGGTTLGLIHSASVANKFWGAEDAKVGGRNANRGQVLMYGFLPTSQILSEDIIHPKNDAFPLISVVVENQSYIDRFTVGAFCLIVLHPNLTNKFRSFYPFINVVSLLVQLNSPTLGCHFLFWMVFLEYVVIKMKNVYSRDQGNLQIQASLFPWNQWNVHYSRNPYVQTCPRMPLLLNSCADPSITFIETKKWQPFENGLCVFSFMSWFLKMVSVSLVSCLGFLFAQGVITKTEIDAFHIKDFVLGTALSWSLTEVVWLLNLDVFWWLPMCHEKDNKSSLFS